MEVMFRDGFRRRILPDLVEFGPDLVLISAGFDGHERDRMEICRCAHGTVISDPCSADARSRA